MMFSCILNDMTVEISLRRPFSIPRVFWAQKDDLPQKYHWVGQKPDVERRQVGSRDSNRNNRSGKSKQKYRPLADITLGEVDDIYQHYEHQLVAEQTGWVGKNYFCQIPLKRHEDGRPPIVFGQMKTCHPIDGIVDNLEEMELYFPHKDGAPDVVHIYGDEIYNEPQRRVQSYLVRVQALASDEDQADLAEAGQMLRTNGFYPDFESSYLDLLEMTAQNQSVYPWMYVIGSCWFASVPESLQGEVAGKLREMVGWGKQIFNYHPEWLDGDIVTLNRILGFKYAFTSQLLVEPGNVQELSFIIARAFDKLIFIPTP